MNRYLSMLLMIATFSATSAVGYEQVDGVWDGGFHCANGEIGASITFKPSTTGTGITRKARMDFFQIEGGAPMPDGSVSLNVSHRGSGKVRLRQNRWIVKPNNWRAKLDRPIGWKEKLQIEARIDATTGLIEGNVVSDDCGKALFRKKGFVAAGVNESVTENPSSSYSEKVARPADSARVPREKTSRQTDIVKPASKASRASKNNLVKSSSEVIPGLDGRFEGAYFCKDGIGEAALVFSIDDDNYRVAQTIDGTTKTLKTRILSYRGDGGLGFELQNKRWLNEMAASQVFGNNVVRVGDQARFINVSMGGLGSDCRGMLLYRFEPIAGLNGEYGAATGLHSACNIIAQHWLGNSDQEEKAARALKIELPRLLDNYTPSTARAAGIHSSGRFENTFGVSPDALSSVQQMDLRTQLRMCALLTNPETRDKFQSAFFVPGSLARSIKVSIVTYWDPRLDVPLVTPLKQIAVRGRAAEKALEGIRSVVEELLILSDAERIRAIAAQRGIINRDVAPSELKAVLDPLIEHLKTLGREQQLMLRAQLGELDVPYEVIPRSAHSLFRQLANQQEVSLDDSSAQYLGGMALFLARDCRLPVEADQRVQSMDFASSAALRAGLGKGYNTPDATPILTDLLSSQLSFKSGFETALHLGCTARFNQQMATLIGTGIATNRGSPDELSLFVRSCAVEFDLNKCGCIQTHLQTVFPDIGKREYNRRFIASTIQQNPLIASRMVLLCKVGDY